MRTQRLLMAQRMCANVFDAWRWAGAHAWRSRCAAVASGVLRRAWASSAGRHRAPRLRPGRACGGQRPWPRCAAAVWAAQRRDGRLEHACPRGVELAWCALAPRPRCACCRLRRAAGGRCIRAAWRRRNGRAGCARPLGARAERSAQNSMARRRRACAALRALVRPARCWCHLAAWVALDARAGAGVALKRSTRLAGVRWQRPLCTWAVPNRTTSCAGLQF